MRATRKGVAERKRGKSQLGRIAAACSWGALDNFRVFLLPILQQISGVPERSLRNSVVMRICLCFARICSCLTRKVPMFGSARNISLRRRQMRYSDWAPLRGHPDEVHIEPSGSGHSKSFCFMVASFSGMKWPLGLLLVSRCHLVFSWYQKGPLDLLLVSKACVGPKALFCSACVLHLVEEVMRFDCRPEQARSGDTSTSIEQLILSWNWLRVGKNVAHF